MNRDLNLEIFSRGYVNNFAENTFSEFHFIFGGFNRLEINACSSFRIRCEIQRLHYQRTECRFNVMHDECGDHLIPIQQASKSVGPLWPCHFVSWKQ